MSTSTPSQPSRETVATFVPMLPLAARRRIMQAALYTPIRQADGTYRWGLPIMFKGGPGTAKTSVAKQVIAYSGFTASRILTPGTNGEGEFGVFPCPSPDGYLDHPPPRWARMFAPDGIGQGRGVVVVDEFTTADEHIQKPIMGLILDGLIGDNDLGHGVRRIGLANPVEMATGGQPLAPPMANRLIHLDWLPPTADEMRAAMMSYVMDDIRRIEKPAAEEERVLAVWDDNYSAAAAGVLQFLTARPDLVYTAPQAGGDQAGGAFNTPRSWTAVMHCSATARVHKLTSDETAALIIGCVGPGVGSEFLAYEDVRDLPSPRDILEGKVEFDAAKVLPDRAYAISTALGAYTMSLPPDCEASDRLIIECWKVMGKVVASGRVDVARAAVQPMTNTGGRGVHVTKGPLGNIVRDTAMPVCAAVVGSGLRITAPTGS